MSRAAYLVFLLVGVFLVPCGKLHAQCSASFSADTTTCAGEAVSFSASGSGNSLKYYWNFGDLLSGTDNEDSLANPSHQFSDSGTFTVTLVIKDSSGCQDTVTKIIRVFQAPQAAFTWQNGCAGLPVSFAQNSNSDNLDSIVLWSWDLGNSSTSSLPDPQTSYTSNGKYIVSLIIGTRAGCRDTLTKSITIFKKPSGTSDVKETCLNGAVDFQADTISTALSYTWDFGDSSVFTQRNVSHIYKKTGTMFPQLTVDFGSTKCTVRTDSIVVHSPPDPSFTIPSDTQCFAYNKVCVQLQNPFQKIKSRTVIFDDGYVDDTASLSNNTICHHYTDIGGGNYSITVEIMDSNNCIASKTSTKAVVIHPEIDADFTFTAGVGCFKTDVFITNTSNQTPPKINAFQWDFGDGNKDSSNWSNLKYTYYADGSFNVQLWIQNTDGCRDTFTASQPVKNTSFVVDAGIDSTGGLCRNNNYYRFKQTPISGASIDWNLGNNVILKSFTSIYRYLYPGVYYPSVLITKNGCDSLLQLDSIVVHGPMASITNFQNRYQCQIKDTVRFQNGSSLFRNKSALSFWDAGDLYGPSCTLVTKDGINIGMNCRYSKDSFSFKHMYQKGQEACYYAKLVVKDTVIGCSDSIYAALPLMAPKADGLFVPTDTTPCPGPESNKTLSFNINLPQPSCLKYAWWVMWDSLAATKTGNFDSLWVYNSNGHNYAYGEGTGDSNGLVSIGLIVENGRDTNGVVCRDTGWFHQIVRVPHMSPVFYSDYDSSKYYCKNATLHFYPADSTQDAGTKFFWSFGDGTTINTTNQGYQTHTFTKAGSYLVQLFVTHPNGCIGDSAVWINIGVRKSFTATSRQECVNDTLQLLEFNYYNNPYGPWRSYWSDTNRAKAGKEQIFYDLGDGNGFQNIGPNPVIRYAYPGTYAISMAIKDSSGCRDTLFNFQSVRISGVYAGFTVPKDTVLCAQILKLTSTATTLDSAVNRGLAGDRVKNWEWDFGGTYPKSYIKDPQRYFATGNYNIKQKVTNIFGCTDSVTKSLVIIGPKAAMRIVSDTIGCEPLLVTFENNSQNATDYIWQFGDKLQSNFGTKSDTNVSFVYKGYGTYYPYLVARGTFTKNNVTQVCDDVFPDTSKGLQGSITVWEVPKPDFTYATNCATGTTSFKNTSKLTTGNVVGVRWYFGDGDTSWANDPTHQYADTGQYKIVLKIFSDHGCEDSMVRNIVISPTPFANFGYSATCQGNNTLFKDSTFAFNDRIYLWKWTFGDGGFSNQKNPSYLFPKDSTYNVKLHVTNIAGCSDSITKPVLIFSKPKPSFTYNNVCDKITATFKNNTTSNQGISSYLWRFGDGASSNNTDASHLYPGYGNYNVKLIATSTKNCMDSLVKNITIHPNPVAIMHINNPSQCYTNHLFVYTDSSTIVSGTTFAKWFFELGDTADGPLVTYMYAEPGVYPVQLTAVSNYGCKDTVRDSVHVNYEPIAGFGLDSLEVCASTNAFLFSDSGYIMAGNYSLKWFFGDGDSSSTTPVTHHYSDTGIFTAMQVLHSNQGCSDTALAQVRVFPMPRPDFTVNDSTQCFQNHQFSFTNNTQIAYGTLNYLWQFGDGQSSNSSNPVHSYNQFGARTVSLHATSDMGCTDSFKKIVEVYATPTATFGINDSLQCFSGNNFILSNTSSIGAGSLSYSWNFGDGNTSASKNISHTYSSHGNYTVKLVVVSDLNCSDSISKPVEVYPMPKAVLQVNQNRNCINQQNFIFRDSSNIAYGILSRKWNFGDSTTSTLTSVAKTFLYPKTYRVWLKELSDKGCEDSAFTDITVYPKPYPSFSINDSTQCLRSNLFAFSDNSKIGSGNLNYTWKLGDGNTKTGSSITHSYTGFGTWKVTLIPLSDKGCSDSASRFVTVYPMPKAAFGENDSTQCLRQNQFNFINNSSIANGSINYFWRFGDPDTSTQIAPTHQYSSQGIYNTTLIATSAFGCADTVMRKMEVYPMPKVAFSVNDSDQCLNRQNFIFTDNSSIVSGTLTRSWKVDDNSQSAASPYLHNFVTDTTHRIKLVQTSNQNCMDSLTRTVIVFSAPSAAYTINDTGQCLRQNQFQFTNTSSIRKDTMRYSWDFGDLNGSSGKNAANQYTTFGTYKVVLVVTSQNSCTDTATSLVHVYPMPQVVFTANDTGQCINNQNFQFTNSSFVAQGYLSHFWKFGDGDTSTLQHPLKTYSYDTSYRVWLSETSDQGCADSVSAMVDVYPKPNVLFTINDSIQCLRQNVFVSTNQSKIKYGILLYQWDLGDGNTSGSNNISHSYTTSGNFVLQLHAVSDLGCKDSLIKPVTVGAMPVPDFLINDPGQCFNDQNFIFTNQSSLQTGSFSSFWKFGDSQTDTTLNSQHIYASFGGYTVRYIATTNYGCQDSTEKPVRVFPNAKAAFTTNDSDQCQNQQNYIFTNTSTVANGKIQSILWDLGNGNSGTTQQIGGYYPNSGTYTIHIYTTTDSGCVDSFSNSIRVYPKPAGSFTVNDSAQCLFQNNYVFTDVSFDSLGINLYHWDINKEVIRTTKTATYKFQTPGFKTIQLISTSLRGCSDTSDRVVYVKPMPDPSFAKLAAYYCELTGPFGLVPATAGGWFSGKNIANQAYNPVILWNDTVKYVVTVNGCTDSSEQYTKVYPGPKVDLGNDTTLCKYEFLHLKINSWNSQYIWNTGNNTADIRITKPGTYTVTVSNICGTKSDTLNVQYRDINCRFFLPTAFTPNKDGLNDHYKPVVFNLDSMDYRIYNRWGELVYKGNLQSPGWDGKYLGALAPDGVYIIYVFYSYSNGPSREQITESASFTLLR